MVRGRIQALLPPLIAVHGFAFGRFGVVSLLQRGRFPARVGFGASWPGFRVVIDERQCWRVFCSIRVSLFPLIFPL